MAAQPGLAGLDVPESFAAVRRDEGKEVESRLPPDIVLLAPALLRGAAEADAKVGDAFCKNCFVTLREVNFLWAALAADAEGERMDWPLPEAPEDGAMFASVSKAPAPVVAEPEPEPGPEPLDASSSNATISVDDASAPLAAGLDPCSAAATPGSVGIWSACALLCSPSTACPASWTWVCSCEDIARASLPFAAVAGAADSAVPSKPVTSSLVGAVAAAAAATAAPVPSSARSMLSPWSEGPLMLSPGKQYAQSGEMRSEGGKVRALLLGGGWLRPGTQCWARQ